MTEIDRAYQAGAARALQEKRAGMGDYVAPTTLERLVGGGAGVLGGGILGERVQQLADNDAPFGQKNLGSMAGGAIGGATGLVAPSAGGAIGGAGLGMAGGRRLGEMLGQGAEGAGSVGELIGGAAGAVGGGRLMELLEERRLKRFMEENRG